MAKSVKHPKETHPEPPAGHTLPPGSEEIDHSKLSKEEELDKIPDEEEDPFETPPPYEEPPSGEGP